MSDQAMNALQQCFDRECPDAANAAADQAMAPGGPGARLAEAVGVNEARRYFVAGAGAAATAACLDRLAKLGPMIAESRELVQELLRVAMTRTLWAVTERDWAPFNRLSHVIATAWDSHGAIEAAWDGCAGAFKRAVDAGLVHDDGRRGSADDIRLFTGGAGYLGLVRAACLSRAKSLQLAELAARHEARARYAQRQRESGGAAETNESEATASAAGKG